MSEEELKDELKPYYQKGDCCSWIVELRKEKAELEQENKQLKDKIKDTIKDLQENNNGDDYSLINVINILKSLLEE